MAKEFDVVVIGGGTAGVIAAVQAGRAGAGTLLVEKNGMLGGTLTVAGISNPAHFFAWGDQIIGGIGWELVRKSFQEMGQPVPGPEFSRENSTMRHLAVDAPVYAAMCDEAALGAGVEILFHAMPAGVKFQGERWILDICTKSGLKPVSAAVLIDATGDANAVSLAGLKTVRPEIVQPATLQMHCSGYDARALDYPALKKSVEKAISSGDLKTTDISWDDGGPEAFLRNYGRNANHIRACGADTSEGRSVVEVEARRAVMRACRFFRRQPGLEKFHIDWICSEAGIRETLTIAGKETIKVKDYESGKMYADAVCYAFYHIDEHLNDGLGINYRPLKKYMLPTIPRGAMLPEDSRFLIVAGRCISSDRESNSAIRVECPCMAMGQAAGAMAALSAERCVDPEMLPITDIYDLLRSHGAVIPGDVRPPV